MGSKSRRDAAGYDEKRRHILRVATEVFARQGFLRTRVGDIATEAGIAYGLIYHYFKSKDDILDCLFEESWALLLKVTEDVKDGPGSARDKLSSIAGFVLEGWRLRPARVEVVLREALRSPKFLEDENLASFRGVFSLIEQLLREHQDGGELRADLDPKLAAILFLGQLEILLTGFVAHDLLAEDQDRIESIRDALIGSFFGGIAA